MQRLSLSKTELTSKNPKKKAKTKQETMEENIDEEPDEQRKRLEALGKRTLELQGYVNQIQDAVTIGMYRLRDLMVSTTYLRKRLHLSLRILFSKS
ncbi:hypothetical protein F5Y12DRAFT_741499 [Xylaria sp. FL1777]|nr:hypothetical protein F5Y12DRAFT_741499 [Xylaria sp. FL1777]